jgi:hypothetical protein
MFHGMRIFKVADGTSWVARLHDGEEADGERLEQRIGWETIVFDSSPAAVAQRLVYRPVGWLANATPAELARALEEGVAVRLRWGDDDRD